MRVSNKVTKDGKLVGKCPVCGREIELENNVSFLKCDCDKNYVLEFDGRLPSFRKVTTPRFRRQGSFLNPLSLEDIEIEESQYDESILQEEIKKANCYLEQLSAREKNDYVQCQDKIHIIKDIVDGEFILEDNCKYRTVFNVVLSREILIACGFKQSANNKNSYILHNGNQFCKYTFDDLGMKISIGTLTPCKEYDQNTSGVNISVLSQLQKILRDNWGDNYELSTNCEDLNSVKSA